MGPAKTGSNNRIEPLSGEPLSGFDCMYLEYHEERLPLLGLQGAVRKLLEERRGRRVSVGHGDLQRHRLGPLQHLGAHRVVVDQLIGEENYIFSMLNTVFYRVTIQVGPNLPLPLKQKFRFGLA